MSRQTQVKAFQQILASDYIPKRHKQALEVLIKRGPLTQGELDHQVAVTDPTWPKRSSRLSELRKMGLLTEDGTRVCSISGMDVILWAAVANERFTPLTAKKQKSKRAQLLDAVSVLMTKYEVTQKVPRKEFQATRAAWKAYKSK